jgi:hypothetical protein
VERFYQTDTETTEFRNGRLSRISCLNCDSMTEDGYRVARVP